MLALSRTFAALGLFSGSVIPVEHPEQGHVDRGGDFRRLVDRLVDGLLETLAGFLEVRELVSVDFDENPELAALAVDLDAVLRLSQADFGGQGILLLAV